MFPNKISTVASKHLVKFPLLLVWLLCIQVSEAQVGIGTNTPDSSAALDISDSARGLLIPRLTNLQKNAIRNPAEGLMIYQTDSVKGFWYFSSGQWRTILPANNTGKHTLILSDNITNAEAQAKIAAEAGPNTQIVRIVGCTQLTAVDLSPIKDLLEIYVYDDSALQTLSLPHLASIEGSLFIDKCPKLTSLALPSLKKISQTSSTTYGFKLTNTGITHLVFPALTKLSGIMFLEYNHELLSADFPQLIDQGTKSTITFARNNKLSSLSFAVLDKIQTIDIRYNPKIVSILLPVLTSISNLYVSSNAELTTFELPAITSLQNSIVQFYSNSQLSSVSLPLLTSMNGSNFIFSVQPNLISFVLPLLTNMAGGQLLFQESSALNNVSLPSLTNVDGTLKFEGVPNVSLSLPVLTTLGGSLEAASSLSSVSAPLLNSAHNIDLKNTKLTSLDLPALSIVNSLSLKDNLSITNLVFPALSGVQQITLDNTITGTASFPALTTANTFFMTRSGSLLVPQLISAGTFSFIGTGATSLSLPAFTTGSLSISNNGPLTTVSAPVFSSGAVSIRNNLTLGSVNFPALASTPKLDIFENKVLQNISLPALTSLTDIAAKSTISMNFELTSINIDNLATINNTGLELSFNLFPSAVINYLLNKFVNINPPLSGKSFLLKQYGSFWPVNPTRPAPPTGQGITDKAILTARPNEVVTD